MTKMGTITKILTSFLHAFWLIFDVFSTEKWADFGAILALQEQAHVAKTIVFTMFFDDFVSAFFLLKNDDFVENVQPRWVR